ncbi:MAG: hypothetical protein P0Y64_14945 [Candidatus Sphingomonas colombiensis]|nr:hypothetical protein [Sphingomonas sp.]WEK42661.1 MAG: hypothetical protein P0Y64_14945 [Sphingomonas sp.]
MIVLLLAQAAVHPAPPPPPVIITTVPRLPSEQGITRPRIRVAVSVRAPEGVLWSGALWVSPRGLASWRQNMMEAQADECMPQNGFRSSTANELNVQLSVLPLVDPAGDERISVNVRWSRPASSPCGGSRIVELQEQARLDKRGPTILKGDGGLVVELRRD